MLQVIDKGIGVMLASIRWFAVPVTLLLFLQWPLRELIKTYSREANDLGQCLFAIFVAASVVAATRAGAHLATDAIARRLAPRVRRGVAAVGLVTAVLPWSAFVLWSMWPALRSSVLATERFPDTGNPGYFILKLALPLLMALVLVQALLDLARGALRS